MDMILSQCNHCGNKGLLEVIGSYNNIQQDEECGWWTDTKWVLLKCPVCGDAVLYKEYKDASSCYYDNEKKVELVDKSIEYPVVSLKFKATPEKIKKAYEAAVKTINIDCSISLLSFRRVLELIAKDKGAIGHDLKSKIDNLSQNNILPPTLKDCSGLIRDLGNVGAHGDTTCYIFSQDVKTVQKFIESIIEYVYECPARIANLTKKVECGKNKTSPDSV